MPWLLVAKKDAESCENVRGLANTNWSVRLRMGQPTWLKVKYTISEQTQGTETSHYLQEKKEKSISLVVASEKEIA